MDSALARPPVPRGRPGRPARLGARARGPADAPRGAARRASPGPPTGRPGRRPTWSPRSPPAASGQPWAHQVGPPRAAHAGQHVVLATGTASGKSLAYQLPALSAVRAARGRAGPARRDRALPRAHQGARPGPAGRARRARPRRAGHHPRRRQQPRAARLGARPRRVRPHQPRHAAPLAAARAPALGVVPRVAGLRRRRRVPPLPGRLRRPRLPRAAPAAAGLRVVRRVTRRSCSPRRPSPSPRSPRTG